MWPPSCGAPNNACLALHTWRTRAWAEAVPLGGKREFLDPLMCLRTFPLPQCDWGDSWWERKSSEQGKEWGPALEPSKPDTWKEEIQHPLLPAHFALLRTNSQSSSWEGPLIVAFDVSDDWSVTWRHVLAEGSPTMTLTLMPNQEVHVGLRTALL